MERDKLLPKEPDFDSTNLSSYAFLRNRSLSTDGCWRSASLREVKSLSMGPWSLYFHLNTRLKSWTIQKGVYFLVIIYFCWHKFIRNTEWQQWDKAHMATWPFLTLKIINSFGVGNADGLKNLEWARIWLTTE